MSEVFGRDNSPSPDLKRNNYDLSCANYLTANFGGFYPCLVKEVLPGDTHRINTNFGLRFLPTLFPLQTKIRADIHFFYVRNRNLWKDWQNFITNNKVKSDLPTIDFGSSLPGVGSLADYMGIPVTTPIINDTTSLSRFPLLSPVTDSHPFSLALKSNIFHTVDFSSDPIPYNYDFNTSPYGSVLVIDDFSELIPLAVFNSLSSYQLGVRVPVLTIQAFNQSGSDVYMNYSVRYVLYDQSGRVVGYSDVWSSSSNDWEDLLTLHINPTYSAQSDVVAALWILPDVDSLNTTKGRYYRLQSVELPNGSTTNSFVFFQRGQDVAANALGLNPFKEEPLSAFPFRAYESIYNSFYRDDRNNPLIIDGETVPNTYIKSNDGGSQPYSDFQLQYRNWEQDFLNTATQSPQQGDAPLVGISDTGVVTVTSDDGREYTAKLLLENPSDDPDVDPIVNLQFQKALPGSVARQLVNYASSGISINDLRNVNAFQRYLETNLRVGLKYKNQLEGRFGVKISYAELDMPEFLGGVSTTIDVSQINNTTESSDAPLGSYAGQLSAIGSSKHTVTNYCDEHGFIIGILSVVPVPIYSDLVEKFWYKKDPLDFWTPEFSHIGNQAIPYREVCPLLVAQDDNYKQTDTFGYQRPWYEYLASVDSVHGLFRTSLNNFVLRRTFRSVPTLRPSFLTVHPNDFNSPFATDTENGDKILGQIYFDITASRPCAKYGQPRLE